MVHRGSLLFFSRKRSILRKWFSVLLFVYTAIPGSAILPFILLTSVPSALGRAPGSMVLSPSQKPDRFLRGDWEAPDTVIVAFRRDFSDFARLLIAEAGRIPGVEIAVLLGQDNYDEGYQWYGQHLADRGNIRLVVLELDTPWIRDYGPLQVYNSDGHVLWLDAPYAYDRPRDDQTPTTLSSIWNVPLETMPWALQGGAIIGNGFGLCASTIEAFQQYEIDPRDRDMIDVLLTQIGCSVLVLVPALANEGTKHIDMFAQFTSYDSVIIADVDESIAPDDSKRMNAAAQGMREAAAAFGIELKVDRVPLPIGDKNRYFSYINGLRLADTFLVPSYSAVPIDQERDAYNALATAIPNAALVTVPADDMIELEGAVHCLSLGLNRK
jgi:agmatine deiminase